MFKLVAIGMILIILGGIAVGVAEHQMQKTVTFKVTDKAVKYDGGHKGTYLIFTDHGVYKDTDSFWFFKFHSSDLYGKLQRGHRYTCKTYGFRVGITSSYPNILSCEDA